MYVVSIAWAVESSGQDIADPNKDACQRQQPDKSAVFLVVWDPSGAVDCYTTGRPIRVQIITQVPVSISCWEQ